MSNIAYAAAAVAALTLCSSAASAQDVAVNHRVELSRQIIEAEGGASNMASMIEGTANSIITALIQKNPNAITDAQKTALQETMRDTAAFVAPQLVDEAARIYATNFTEQQLTDMLAFYRSPTGQALAAKLPEIGRESGAMMVKYQPAIQYVVVQRLCAKLGCGKEVEQQLADLKQKAPANFHF